MFSIVMVISLHPKIVLLEYKSIKSIFLGTHLKSNLHLSDETRRFKYDKFLKL